MRVKTFDAWRVYTVGIVQLIANDLDLTDDMEVWIGADGSYAIGDITAIYDMDPNTDPDHYTEAGTVAEYRRDE